MSPVPTKNSTSPVILIAIAVLGLITGYFYYAQSLQGQSFVVPASVEIPADDSLVKFKDLKLDFSALDNLTFQALRVFGESPVLPGVTGRVDIFAPF